MTPVISNRKFGIEIEIAGSEASVQDIACKITMSGVPTSVEAYNHLTRNHWKIVGDASINRNRGSAHGTFELVSPILQGADGVEQLRKVCVVLAETGCVVNKSCGLHVHHDAHDYKTVHFQRLLNFYHRAQASIDMLVSPSRRGNNNYYCRNVPANIIHVMPRGSSRYYKLNLQAYYRHGTVEFRQHQGTISFEKMLAWVMFTQHIVERCKRAFNTQTTHRMTWFDTLQALGYVHHPQYAEIARILKARYERAVAALGNIATATPRPILWSPTP